MLFAFLLAYLIFLLLNGDFIVLMINEMWVADYICLFCFWKVKLNELNNNNKKTETEATGWKWISLLFELYSGEIHIWIQSRRFQEIIE